QTALRNVTYANTSDAPGTDPRVVRFSVSDGSLGSAATNSTVTITVTPVNDAPIAVDDSVNGTEDVALDIVDSTLLANDHDADGTRLSVAAVSNPSHGTVSHAGGHVPFPPAANYNGVAGFDYTISDGQLTGTAHVTVNLT